MKKRRQVMSLVLAALIMTWAGALQAEDFYSERLAAGKAEYAAKKFDDAVSDFRIASFGFLDRPPLLSESLVRLALASSAAKKPDELKSALDRFVEQERRFPALENAALDPETRKQFQELAAREIAEATLRSIPSLASLVETEEQKYARLPPKEKARILDQKMEAEPREARWPLDRARLASEEGDDKAVVRWASRALDLDAGNADALVLRAHALTSRREYTQALSDLSALLPAAFTAKPDLLADRFVCEVALRQWDAAQSTGAALPAAALDRKDVVRAQSDLAREVAARKKSAESAAKSNGMDVPEKTDEPSAAGPVTPPEPPPPVVPPAPPPPAPPAPVPVPEPPPPAPSSPPARTPPPPMPSPSLDEIHQLVLAGQPAIAEKRLLALEESAPGRRDVRLALLEAACLSRDWKTGLAQVAVLDPFQEGEEPAMFYAAVVTFESGGLEKARAYAAKARAKIAASPYTQYYMKKILP